jgi:hypothetical protein
MIKSLEFDIRKNDSIIKSKENKIDELSERFINMQSKLSKYDEIENDKLSEENNIKKLQQDLDESTANAMKKLHEKAKSIQTINKNKEKEFDLNKKDLDEKQKRLEHIEEQLKVENKNLNNKIKE